MLYNIIPSDYHNPYALGPRPLPSQHMREESLHVIMI